VPDGAECNQFQFLAGRCALNALFFSLMIDDQGAALMRGRQYHEQRGHHAGQFLGILMRVKELTGLVNQQMVSILTISDRLSAC
jgi:hypothetical protein